ncbi:hypothetical protein [Deinococcus aestuarii]|uniref:hypothetical protein n=1 Tax=Deinococcus aestuarii TaxID=2774531 RepID=UPI001C0C466C|nr:hypothetical protein [Deinococcus aestuarii]
MRRALLLLPIALSLNSCMNSGDMTAVLYQPRSTTPFSAECTTLRVQDETLGVSGEITLNPTTGRIRETPPYLPTYWVPRRQPIHVQAWCYKDVPDGATGGTTRVETGTTRVTFNTPNWGSFRLSVGSSEGMEAATLARWRASSGAQVTGVYPVVMP